jgi:hypothetical protein
MAPLQTLQCTPRPPMPHTTRVGFDSATSRSAEGDGQCRGFNTLTFNAPIMPTLYRLLLLLANYKAGRTMRQVLMKAIVRLGPGQTQCNNRHRMPASLVSQTTGPSGADLIP